MKYYQESVEDYKDKWVLIPYSEIEFTSNKFSTYENLQISSVGENLICRLSEYSKYQIVRMPHMHGIL